MGFSLEKTLKKIGNGFTGKGSMKWINPAAAVTRWSFENPKQAALFGAGAFGAGMLSSGFGSGLAAGQVYNQAIGPTADGSNLGGKHVKTSTQSGSSGFGSGLFGDILGAALGVGGSYLTSRDQLSQQMKLQDRAFAQNVQMWNLQNAYNTPKAQMERYEEAGLNPNIIYGSGSTSAGNAPAAPSYEAPHYKGMELNSIMAVMNLQNMQQQNELLRAQTAAAIAQAENTGMNTIYRGAELKWLPRRMKADIAHTLSDTKYMPLRIPWQNWMYDDTKSNYNTLTDVVTGGAPKPRWETDNSKIYVRILKNKYGSNWRKHYGERIGNMTGVFMGSGRRYPTIGENFI